MPIRKHPLTGHKKWVHETITIGCETHYLTRPISGKSSTKHDIAVAGSCREGIIFNIREALQAKTFRKKQTGKEVWEKTPVQEREVVLDTHQASERTRLYINDTYFKGSSNPASHAIIDPKEFLQVADAIAGLPCLLLSPDRQSGDWWKTPSQDLQKNGRVYWHGTDNFLLQHPALVAVVTGLYRQAHHLCKAGLGPQILKEFRRQELEKVLTSGEWEPAFRLANRLKPWIQVPPGKYGAPRNYPFPWHEPAKGRVSYWQRFVRLQRAVRRHGYEDVLGETIAEGWGLGQPEASYYTGAYSFWGEEENLTERHKRLMKLGKPVQARKKP